jgi:transcriptional regulator with XRE-family HTH domain
VNLADETAPKFAGVGRDPGWNSNCVCTGTAQGINEMAPPSSHTCRHPDDIAGLGALLRRARLGRGLTLEQISKETKIPRRHLEALEHDNVAAVPGEFYRRAEIRAYARAVRLDQDIALAELDRAERPPVAGGAIVKRALPQKPAIFRKRVLIAIGVLGAAAVLGRAMGERAPALDTHAQMPQRTHQLARAIPSSPSVGSLPVAIEPAVPVSAASNSNVPVTTDPGETRISADAATELVVTTDPPGARVTVNGIGWGTTPVTIRYLPAGQKRIRVTKEGYASEERMVRVTDGQPGMVDIQLRGTP